MRLIFISASIYLYTASLFSLMIGIYIIVTKKGNLARSISLLLLALSIYLFGYAMELNSTNLQGMIFWNYFQYLTIPLIPAFWLLAAIQFSTFITRPKPYVVLFIFLVPAITYITRWTNPYFHLFYTSMELHDIAGQPVMLLEKGVWYFMQVIYATGAFLIALILYIKHYLSTSVHTDRKTALLLVVGSSLPWVGLLGNLINPGNLSLDYTALVFPLSSIMLAGVLFTSDFLRIKPLARETLFNSTSNGVIVLDSRLRIADSNPAARVMVPVLESLKPGTRIDEAIPAYNENPQEGDLSVCSWENGTNSYESRMSPLVTSDGQNRGYLVTIYDTTEQQRKIRSLKESEQRFRTLMRDIPSLAVQGIDASGAVFYWNRGSELFYGYSASEAIGKRIEELIVPEEMSAEIRREISGMLRGEHIQPKEMELIRKDGTPIQVYTAFSVVQREGAPPELFTMDIDLRSIRKTQETLKRSQENLIKIINLTPYMLSITDSSGTILLANKLFKESFPSQGGCVVGNSIYALWGEEPQARMLAALDREVLASGTGVYSKEFSYTDAKGKQQVMLTKVPFISTEDDSPCVLTIMVNITNERNLEEQLRHTEKIKAIGQLSGGIAHEMNNMLQVIMGYAEMILELTDADDTRREMVESILSTGQKSAGIVRQLLAFARKQPNAPRKLKLNGETGSMLEVLQRLVGDNIQLVWEPSQEDPAILMDPAQLGLILTNLISNARDAIAQAGTITIQTLTMEADTHTHGTIPLAPGRYAMLMLTDTGHGIDPSIKDRVFEPFFTTKPVGSGTGLGLSTVMGIMEQHQGSISIEDAQPSGTQVSLYFPLHDYPDQPSQPGFSTPGLSQTGNETILAVEDEQKLLQFITLQLESLGYTVLPALSPREAVSAAEAHQGKIHLLVTDVIMPEMDGTELYKLLLQKHSSLKVLYVSGHAGSLTGEVSRSGHFLEKPFTKHILASGVRSALDG